jgi:pseudoazurin
MIKIHFLTSTALLAVAIGLLSSAAIASNVEVKMLNKGADGSIMVFEPALVKIAPGDSVHFVATDKSHDVLSVDGMIPEGATPFAGKMNEDITVKFDKPGVYVYRCKPHYVMGMVGMVVVGNPVNEDAVKTGLNSGVPNLAKNRLTKLFATLDGK